MPSKLPNLRQLRFFTELARVGHFGRTATKLGIDQPTLTKEVRRFEVGYKVDLLTRHSKGVIPTAAGNRVAKIGEALFALVDKLDDVIGFHEEATRIKIGLPTSLAPSISAVLCHEILTEFPNADIGLVEGPTSFLESRILDGSVDLAILNDPPNFERLSRDLLFEERLVLACSPSWSPPRSSHGFTFRELADLPLVLPSSPFAERRLIARVEVKQGLRLDPVLEVDALATRIALVRKGVGATVISRIAVQMEASMGQVQIFPIISPELRTGVYTCWLELDDRSSILALRALVSRTILSLRQWLS